MFVGNVLLALAWATLQAEFTLVNLLVGHAVGYVILTLLVKGGVLAESRYIGKVRMTVGFIGFFLRELVVANLRLTRDVISLRSTIRPGIIAVPLDVTRDSEILLLATLINLTPGSVALDVSPDRKVMYVHSMYVKSPDAARAEIKNGYERRIVQLLR